MTTVSVCICTFRRPERLGELLRDLAAQTRLPEQVVVVDNDAGQSARDICGQLADEFRAQFALIYACQPVQNISLTRNRTVELATGEWLAMLDDDERVIPQWLALLLDCQRRHAADGVLAPVVCQVPPNAAEWIRRGQFYALPRFATGVVPPLNRIGIGNALLNAALLRREPGPFNPDYGLTGGEDSDLLTRLVLKHQARLVWCDEALATEAVEPARLRLQWLLKRSLRGGQDHAKHFWAGRFGAVGLAGRASFIAKAVAQLLVFAVLSPLLLPLGRHRAVAALRRAVGNFGKLSALWGWHHQEYAAAASARAGSALK